VRWGARAVISAVAVTAVAGCASTTSPGAGSGPPPAAVALAASVQTATATWAAVAMGHLADPTNTYWEVFVRRAGAARWSLVTPTGVADVGGLVVAASPGGTAVGFLPSAKLTFSPLALTATLGARYAPALITAGLASTPDALAVATSGALAVVDGGARVLSARTAAGPWGAATTAAALDRVIAGQACGQTTVTAAALTRAGGFLGLACTRPGVVGLVTLATSTPTLVPVTLPRALAHLPVTVLRAVAVGGELVALLQAGSGPGAYDVVARVLLDPGQVSAAHPPVTVSAAVPSPQPVLGTSVGAGGTVALLTGQAGGPGHVAVQPAGSTTWQAEPAPPAGTAVVTVTGDTLDALAVNQADLAVSRLRDGVWGVVQRLTVPISYGSGH